jgi:hypothetical protein
MDSQDSPRPRLEGSHHLPPYSILYASPRHLHPNGFLSRFGLSPLCRIITLFLDLRLKWSLKQTCSSYQELSNGVLHSTCTHRVRVDSWLLVVGSQTASLVWLSTFLFVLTCAVDVQMAHASPFSTFTLWYLSNVIKNTSMRSVLTPTIEFWSVGSPDGLPSPHFGSVSVILPLFQK